MKATRLSAKATRQRSNNGGSAAAAGIGERWEFSNGKKQTQGLSELTTKVPWWLEEAVPWP